MSLRTRITLLFIALTSILLATFSLVIYFSAKATREREFYELLRKEAITKANLFFVAKIPAETLQDIYKSNRQTLNEVEVAIYDRNFELLYHDAYEIDFVKETREMIDAIYEQGEVKFYQDKWQVIGTVYRSGGSEYALTAAAFDGYGYSKLESLRNTLIFALGVYVLAVFGVGRFFTQRVVAPLQRINQSARRVSASSLNMRLAVEPTGDELEELATTFNQMLDRLEKAFASQKEFVSSVAHELRTPLTAMIMELDILLSKPRHAEAYEDAARKLLSDAKRLKKILQSLIDFARASYDAAEIQFEPLRLDEALVSAQATTLNARPNAHIEIAFETDSDDERAITISANRYLIELAFVNLLDNACKFSADQTARVVLKSKGKVAVVEISDKGIGIEETEIEKIFTPFYRGKNHAQAEGSGIGLALTKRIVELHRGTLSVRSQLGNGTTFTLEFPNQLAQSE
ncbi:MAG: ATP-binding protein [Chloroherpetonaceae bacterium]|nr:ATP-binding protein [Chloroherpetonaceae bacterium]MDW8020973.1 ATP-binding protein [Chloroherpetonaceae bacterium]